MKYATLLLALGLMAMAPSSSISESVNNCFPSIVNPCSSSPQLEVTPLGNGSYEVCAIVLTSKLFPQIQWCAQGGTIERSPFNPFCITVTPSSPLTTDTSVCVMVSTVVGGTSCNLVGCVLVRPGGIISNPGL